MPRKQFSDILNREKNKTGFVLGLGPSLRQTLPIIHKVQGNKTETSIITCNNADLMIGEIAFDYWMLAQPADINNPLSIQNASRRYNSHPETLFLYTDCLERTSKEDVARLLNIDYIGYDQRHFNGEHCGWGSGKDGRNDCCDAIETGRLCIQEELKRFTGHDEMYGCGDTVGVHMIALAVILGLNPIYVTGIDLDYSKGYVNNDADVNIDYRINLGKSVMAEEGIMIRILHDVEVIRNSAKRIGTEIYVMTEGKLSQVLSVKQPDHGR